VLAQANEGIYTIEQTQDLSPERLRRFFLKGTGTRAGFVKLKPELRALVSFAKHNLRDENWGLSESFDGIFCRNVNDLLRQTDAVSDLKPDRPRAQT